MIALMLTLIMPTFEGLRDVPGNRAVIPRQSSRLSCP
jgi:hypothetical protein